MTIRDVAQRAGVGLGTVSRVLNDSPLVSDTTRDRVLHVIRELNFSPNPHARRLSLGKTLTIGVVIPFFTLPSFVERLRGVESALANTPFDLLITNVENPARRATCFRDSSRRNRVDGLLVISLPPFDHEIALLLNAGVPVVLIDVNNPRVSMFPRLTVDDLAGGKRATEHLIQLGHTRIAMVSDTLSGPFNFTATHDRYRGYRQALKAAGIPCNPLYHREVTHSRHEAKIATHELMRLSLPPTAIFAGSDTQALGVLEAAQELRINVPDELSVVGYDDIDMAAYLGLTTTRQLLFESGQKGAELLLDLIATSQQPLVPFHEEMPTEFVVRQTTKPYQNKET